MSEDQGVTPLQVACEVTPGEVTPGRGKGALGTWRACTGYPDGTQRPIERVKIPDMSSHRVNLVHPGWMRASARASAHEGRPDGDMPGPPTGLGKSDRPG